MPRTKNHWLLKSEPDVYSFDDLLAEANRTTVWDGVRNHQAKLFLRDGMRVGDGVLFYHSSCAEPGIYGLAEVARAGYPDPSQFDRASKYFDPKADPGSPTWSAVDVRAKRALPRPVLLADLRAEPRLVEMAVLRRGQRLSVQPVTPAEWKIVLELAGARA
ncbi:MAG: EVE domain-containing protein [Planctomycetota bacterium]